MKKIVAIIPIIFIAFILVAKGGLATEKLTFDSTSNYIGTCQMTDKSQWQIESDILVTKFQIWYKWNQGETELPVKLYKDGVIFAEFTAVRSSCDPYQSQWCNADFAINKTFTRGKYTTEIGNKRQCLKPGGTGTVRLYSDDGTTAVTPTVAASATSTPLPTVMPTTTVEPTIAAIQSQTTASTCNCNQTMIVTSAAATSGVVSLLVWMVMKKF